MSQGKGKEVGWGTEESGNESENSGGSLVYRRALDKEYSAQEQWDAAESGLSESKMDPIQEGEDEEPNEVWDVYHKTGMAKDALKAMNIKKKRK